MGASAQACMFVSPVSVYAGPHTCCFGCSIHNMFQHLLHEALLSTIPDFNIFQVCVCMFISI